MHGHDPDPPLVADDRPPAPVASRPRRHAAWLLVGLLSALLVVGWLTWDRRPAAPPAAPAPAPAASVATPAAPASAAASAVLYPVPPSADATPLPALDESDIEVARLLESAVGREALAQLRTAGFVRHVVATVDNLPRERASATLWPVNPTPGRLVVDGSTGASTLSPDNDLRYAALVQLAEAIDIPTALRLYQRLYPLFQQAYEELGYPGRPFNDRLVAVIDHLLAAPEPAGPVGVQPLAVQGPVPLARPWQHHVFTDPALESLSAGQKIMVRVGAVNERRLKDRLRAWRQALTQGAAAP